MTAAKCALIVRHLAGLQRAREILVNATVRCGMRSRGLMGRAQCELDAHGGTSGLHSRSQSS
jgi:hypothetical protein